jgi:hypothetical protein
MQIGTSDSHKLSSLTLVCFCNARLKTRKQSETGVAGETLQARRAHEQCSIQKMKRLRYAIRNRRFSAIIQSDLASAAESSMQSSSSAMRAAMRASDQHEPWALDGVGSFPRQCPLWPLSMWFGQLRLSVG